MRSPYPHFFRTTKYWVHIKRFFEGLFFAPIIWTLHPLVSPPVWQQQDRSSSPLVWQQQLGRSSEGLSLLLPHKYNYVSQSFKSSTPRETGLVRLPRQVSRHLLFIGNHIKPSSITYILYSSVLKLYKPFYY